MTDNGQADNSVIWQATITGEAEVTSGPLHRILDLCVDALGQQDAAWQHETLRRIVDIIHGSEGTST